MRTPKTSAEIREIASRIQSVVDSLAEIAEKMDREKLPQVLVHGEDKVNRHIPDLRKWAATMAVDLDTEIDAMRRGAKSPALATKERAAQQAKSHTARRPKR
jgi:hypothetical protein